jgi:hypothetical protein
VKRDVHMAEVVSTGQISSVFHSKASSSESSVEC